jgi:formylglycine-generating enzyme
VRLGLRLKVTYAFMRSNTLLAALLVSAANGCETKRQASVPTAALDAGTPQEASVASTSPRCPDAMARIEDFCIDRYEAHLVDANAPERVISPFGRPDTRAKVMARSRAGVIPQAYLNRFEAASACGSAGKRLCRAREWYRACAGRLGWRYPYGDKEVRGRCNTGKPHVMQRLFGDVQFTFIDHYNSPRLNQEPGFLAASGEYAACVSEDGVGDMVGNLHEWVLDAVSLELSREVPLEVSADKLGASGNAIFMGGYYSSHGEHGAGCAYATTHHKPDYHDYSIGFRCCADAPTDP